MKIEVFGDSRDYSAHGTNDAHDPALSPCPFCGDATQLTAGNTWTDSYAVECKACGARGPGAGTGQGRFRSKKMCRQAHEESLALAIQRWNSSHAPKATP